MNFWSRLRQKQSAPESGGFNINVKAKLALKFIVIGGSVGGLSAAAALSASGHHVVVLEREKRERFHTRGTVRCPPNMARLLQGMPGAEVLFKQKSAKIERMNIKDGSNLKTLGAMQFDEAILAEFQAEYYVLQYQDLVAFLESNSRKARVPATFRYGVSAEEIEPTGKGVNVRCSDGSVVSGDIVIAADGRASAFRDTIAEEDNHPETQVNGCSFHIPGEILRQHPELSVFSDTTDWTIHSAATHNGCCVITTYNDTYDILDVGSTFVNTDNGDDFFKESNRPNIDLSAYDPRLQALFQLGRGFHQTVHDLYQVEEWIGLDNRALLLGDACHSSLIHASYNASLAVEDAFVLGHIFSYLSSRKQIPFLLNAYQEIQQPRAAHAQAGEYMARVLLTLPEGDDRNARDASLSVTLKMADGVEMGDEMVAAAWAGYVQSYSYSPQEAVEGWWSQWGNKVREMV